MKPLFLSMQAFGPFSGRQDIDFSLLGEGAFFLIHGPTGAGKTTLLDALCFALYGDTSGGERRGQDMRSDHADRGTPTWVELTFSLGSARYKVRRSPTQERPKHRGEGTVLEQAKAELHHFSDSDWKIVETQPGRVDERVRALLGFDSAQFRQVIVLPQGRFRELLTADSKSRQQILERLFQTEIYRRIEEALKAEAASIRGDAEKLQIEKSAILGVHGVESEETLHESVLAASAECETATERVRAARLENEVCVGALQQGERVASLLNELKLAQSAHSEISKRGSEIAATKTRLEAARRALAVQPAYLEWKQLLTQAEDAKNAVQAARSSLDSAREAHTVATVTLEAATRLEAENADMLSRITLLEDSLQRVDRISKAKLAEEAAVQRREVATHTESQARSALQALETQRDHLQPQRDAAQRLASGLPALELRIETLRSQEMKLRNLSTALHELNEARKKEEVGKDAEGRAEVRLQQEKASLLQREALWLKGQASRLAAQLHEHEPCPVCGNTAHPHPADPSEALSDEQLDDARVAVTQAENVLSTCRAARHRASGRVLTCEERVRGLQADTVVTQVADEDVAGSLETALKERGEAQRAAQLLVTLTTQYDSVVSQIPRARECLEIAVNEANTAREQHAQCVGATRAAEASLTVQAKDAAALRSEIAALRTLLEKRAAALSIARAEERKSSSLLEGCKARCDSLQSSERDLRLREEQAFARFMGHLNLHGFDSVDDYVRASMSLSEQDACAQAISAYEAAVTSADDRLLRASEACRGVEAPDLAGLSEAAQRAKAKYEGCTQQLHDMTAKRDGLRRAAVALSELKERAGHMEARYAVVGRLSEIANGNNPRRMTFQRFVLATLLDEVLEAASLRLRRMSRNRYELRRVMQQADLRQAGGLDLEVLDHETGLPRPANTLSGGEGFLASLSLALGLADVVQSRAGGIQLETLFVDEGFGSLDPESLDFAIRTLLDLQQAGRLVGIISHVAELRERIDVRLEVRASARGSTVGLTIG